MKVTFNKFWLIIIGLIIFVLQSCHTKKAPKNINYEDINNQVKCQLIESPISLGAGIFEPFDSVYLSFLKEKHDFDIIIRRIGQSSILTRAYLSNKKFITIEEYDKKHGIVKKKKEISFQEEIILSEKGDYFFLCNQQSSHLDTHIYAIKIKGEIVTQLWFDNGDYSGLSIINKEKLKNTLKMISLILTN